MSSGGKLCRWLLSAVFEKRPFAARFPKTKKGRITSRANEDYLAEEAPLGVCNDRSPPLQMLVGQNCPRWRAERNISQYVRSPPPRRNTPRFFPLSFRLSRRRCPRSGPAARLPSPSLLGGGTLSWLLCRLKGQFFYRMVLGVLPQWIRTYPEDAAPRTGEGLFPGEVIEVDQVWCCALPLLFSSHHSDLCLSLSCC